MSLVNITWREESTFAEPCVPDVSLTRSRDGSTGVATFTFDNPTFLSAASEALGETTGMYLKDSEGTIQTSEVRRSPSHASLVSRALNGARALHRSLPRSSTASRGLSRA